MVSSPAPRAALLASGGVHQTCADNPRFRQIAERRHHLRRSARGQNRVRIEEQEDIAARLRRPHITAAREAQIST